MTNADIADLQRRWLRMHEHGIRAQENGPTARMRILGTGLEEIRQGFERLEPMTRRTVWNLHRVLAFDKHGSGAKLNERSRARGVDIQMVVSPYALNLNPLLPSDNPTLRIAPVFGKLLVLDQNLVVLAGPPADDGQPRAWITDAEDVVRDALDLWHTTQSVSRPANPDPTRPPLTRRQVAVAGRMLRGDDVRAIADALHLSARTVERELSVVLAELGVARRAEAIATFVQT